MALKQKTAGFRTLVVTLLLYLPVSLVNADTKELPLDGFDIANYHGRVVYLDFWASWCGPCRATFPMMNDLREHYSEEELAIIAVNVDSQRAEANRFLEKYPADFSVLYDPQGTLASQYELAGMPTSYLFNQRGELMNTHVGFRKDDADMIKQQLAEAIRANPAKEISD